MGDGNSVEFAMGAHMELLARAGGFGPDDALSYGRPTPAGKFITGVVVDDHAGLEVVQRHGPVWSPPAQGPDVFARSRAEYQKHGLTSHPAKAVRGAERATVWGMHLDGTTGVVTVPRAKLLALCSATVRVVKLGFASVALLSSLTGLWVSAFVFTRRLLSLLDLIYECQRGRQPSDILRLSRELKAEMLVLVTLAPLSGKNLRKVWHSKTYVVDASLSKLAVCEADSPPGLGEVFDRFALRGPSWVRLLPRGSEVAYLHDQLEGALQLPGIGGQMRGCEPFTETVPCLDWQVVEVDQCRKGRHINLSEGESLRRAEAFASSELDSVVPTGSDSLVCVGAFRKGRSSSAALNSILRSTIPFAAGCGLEDDGWYVPSGDNPCDDPTRDVPLRAPCPTPEWWTPGGRWQALSDRLKEWRKSSKTVCGPPLPPTWQKDRAAGKCGGRLQFEGGEQVQERVGAGVEVGECGEREGVAGAVGKGGEGVDTARYSCQLCADAAADKFVPAFPVLRFPGEVPVDHDMCASTLTVADEFSVRPSCSFQGSVHSVHLSDPLPSHPPKMFTCSCQSGEAAGSAVATAALPLIPGRTADGRTVLVSDACAEEVLLPMNPQFPKDPAAPRFPRLPLPSPTRHPNPAGVHDRPAAFHTKVSLSNATGGHKSTEEVAAASTVLTLPHRDREATTFLQQRCVHPAVEMSAETGQRAMDSGSSLQFAASAAHKQQRQLDPTCPSSVESVPSHLELQSHSNSDHNGSSEAVVLPAAANCRSSHRSHSLCVPVCQRVCVREDCDKGAVDCSLCQADASGTLPNGSSHEGGPSLPQRDESPPARMAVDQLYQEEIETLVRRPPRASEAGSSFKKFASPGHRALLLLPRHMFLLPGGSRPERGWTPEGAGLLDLYSGEGGWAEQMFQRGYSWVLQVDVVRDAEWGNLLDPRIRRLVNLVVLGRAVCGIGAAPVCSSFSQAVRPCPRSREHPRGNPGLSPSMFRKVAEGNKHCDFVAGVLCLALRVQLHMWIESPHGSWLWRQRC